MLYTGVQSAGCADVGLPVWHNVQDGPLSETPASDVPWQYWFAQALAVFVFT